MNKTTLLSIASAALLAACGGSTGYGSGGGGGAGAQYITFQGNGNAGAGAVFNGPHAGQTVRAALLDGPTVIDIQKTVIAATGTDPAFSVTFAPAYDPYGVYTVDYWIDSNFGLISPAGVGECDPPANDHQWSVAIPAGRMTYTDVHRPGSTTSVCSTFTFPLTFVGDTSFTGPHPGQAFKAALVRGSDTSAEETLSGTVAASGAVPAFSVTFTHALVIGEPYSVKLWIDSNASGACDPADHQWSVNIPTALASHASTFTYAHNTTFTSVCSFFP